MWRRFYRASEKHTQFPNAVAIFSFERYRVRYVKAVSNVNVNQTGARYTASMTSPTRR